MKYDGHVEKWLDNKLLQRWEGPFKVKEKFKTILIYWRMQMAKKFLDVLMSTVWKYFTLKFHGQQIPMPCMVIYLGGKDVTLKNDIFFWNLGEDAWGPQGDKIQP